MLYALRRSVQPKGPDRSLSERCLTFGAPQLTQGYQSYYQIMQAPRSVMVMTEMIHDARVIPTDNSPHPPASIQQWLGDSRGHWEGDKLVIDRTNFNPIAIMSISTEKLHVTERFSRTGPDTVQYEIADNDPGTWTKPWSVMMSLRRSDHPVYEYACHEGNKGLQGILAGARTDEASAATDSG